MFHVITGGSGSGKSEYAEDMIVRYADAPDGGEGEGTELYYIAPDGGESTELYYIATMMPFDEETREKIRRHQRMRAGKGFQTVECYRDLRSGVECIFGDGRSRSEGAAGEGGTDTEGKPCRGKSWRGKPRRINSRRKKPSVLLECMSNLTANELFSGQDFVCGETDGGQSDRIIHSIMEGIYFLKENCANLVVVTNEVFSECAQDSREMRVYKEILGGVNQMMARSADCITEVVYGIPVDAGGKACGGGERSMGNCGGVRNDGAESGGTKNYGEQSMRMIIGGACQGKLDYARTLYPGVEWVDGRDCGGEAIYQCGGIYHFETYIARLLRGEFGSAKAREEFCRSVIRRNPGLVIVTDEIGCGLVPIDAFDRRYREETGRICTRLAAFSSRVDRVVCGIGTVIKGGEKTDEDRA